MGLHTISAQHVSRGNQICAINNYIPIFTDKQVGTSHELRRLLVEGKMEGKSQRVPTLNRHGRSAGTVVQITCDQDVEDELLTLMRCMNIQALPNDKDTVAMLTDHTVTGHERFKGMTAHMEGIKDQWWWCAEAENVRPEDHILLMESPSERRVYR